ncbi:MAG: metallopeptidase TldD-related protein, partial [Gammaproteobacteria bacterium]|nr:metallopeptidase TldD-related protein [Gammaproteobacteria bacterium]
GAASAPFDAEGVATQERTVVDNGILRGWFLSSYSARRLGLASTGNAGGVRNLVLESREPALSWDELLQRLGRGLVVTELMGQGVNQVTGDYSRGATGFWVENGAVAHPVHEITIAGSLPDMYRDIVAVGVEQDRRGSLQTGALLVDRMQIAGV